MCVCVKEAASERVRRAKSASAALTQRAQRKPNDNDDDPRLIITLMMIIIIIVIAITHSAAARSVFLMRVCVCAVNLCEHRKHQLTVFVCIYSLDEAATRILCASS